MALWDKEDLVKICKEIEDNKELLSSPGLSDVGKMFDDGVEITNVPLLVQFFNDELGINVFDEKVGLTLFPPVQQVNCFNKITAPKSMTRDRSFDIKDVYLCTANVIDLQNMKAIDELTYFGDYSASEDFTQRQIILPDNVRKFSHAELISVIYPNTIFLAKDSTKTVDTLDGVCASTGYKKLYTTPTNVSVFAPYNY